MDRRAFLASGGASMMRPGLGRATPSRFPYPGRPETAPGLGPGQAATLRARRVIVFGPDDGVFVYNGSPRLGNPPVDWVANTTVDPFGNVLPAKDIVSQDTATGRYSQLTAGLLKIWPGSGFNPGSIGALSSGQMNFASPTTGGGDVAATMALISKAVAPFGFAEISMVGGLVIMQFTGTAAGFIGSPVITQTDTGTNTLGNVAGNVALSAQVSVPADDMSTGTIFELESPLTGMWENNVLNIGILMDGVTFTNITPVGATWVTAGHGVVGTVRLKVTCTQSGALGTVNIDVDGTLVDSSVARTPATSVDLDGHHLSLAYDTTVSHFWEIAANWGGLTAGQTISGQTTEITRSGPL